MNIRTTVRSWLALVAGLLFIAGTGVNLLSDVILEGAPPTIAHMNAILALVAALVAGHLGFISLRHGIIIPGILLVAVFFVSTAWVAIKSGDRNAERADIKYATGEDHSAEIANYTKMRNEALYILAPCPAGTPDNHRGIKCGLREAMATECSGGKGKRCDGRAYSVSTYEAAISGYEGRIAKLKTDAIPPVKQYARAAQFLASVMSMDETRARGLLVLYMPFLNVFINEIMLIGIMLLAFEHRIDQPQVLPTTIVTDRRAPVASVPVEDPKPPTVTPRRTAVASSGHGKDEPIEAVSLGWTNDVNGPARPRVNGVKTEAETKKKRRQKPTA